MTTPAAAAPGASGTPLSPDELLAFAGLARLLVQADGKFSKDEAAALEEASADLFGGTQQLGGGPYREQAAAADEDEQKTERDKETIFELIERAASIMPDEDAVRTAAKGVTRQEARDLIFAVLYEVAASDVIAKGEWPVLDWLKTEWGVEVG